MISLHLSILRAIDTTTVKFSDKHQIETIPLQNYLGSDKNG